MGDNREIPRDIVFCGTLVHATDEDPMVLLENHCLGVVDGKIVFVKPIDELEECLVKFHIDRKHVKKLTERQFVMPGLIDTHIHAPQYPNAGKGLDVGLLDWLKKYTFPTEATFKDLKYADMAYRKAVKRVLRNGTTTACYFATIHTDASILLCDIIDELGQRAYVGKCNIDQNSPEYYIEESASHSIAETKRFVEAVLNRKCSMPELIVGKPLTASTHLSLASANSAKPYQTQPNTGSDQYKHVTPCITPRFSVTCSRDLLDGLGHLAKTYDLPIQTVLAHGIHLSQPEIDIIKKRGSSISHCANSNLSLRSGLLDLRNLLNQNVKVGLGTDVSGGYHPSIIDAIRSAIHVSNTQAILNSTDYQPINVKEAFRLATLGGSKAMALDKKIGNFECGKEFDALIVDPDVQGSPMNSFEEDTVLDVVEKFLYTGDDRNITAIFVGGRNVLK